MLTGKFVRALSVLLLGAALAGCGADKKDDTPSGPSPRDSTSSRDAPADGDGRATGDELRSFHYVVTIDMEVEGGEDGISGTIEGDYFGPDAHAFTQEYQFAGLTISESYVLIGDDAWSREGNGSWEATTADDPDVVDALDMTSADPEFFAFDDEFAGDISFVKGEDDVKNGIDTTRIEIDAEQWRRLGNLFDGGDLFAGTDAEGIEEMAMKVWLTRDETALVALDIDAAFGSEGAQDFPFEVPPGGRLRMRMTVDLSRLNDDAISVEPPI